MIKGCKKLLTDTLWYLLTQPIYKYGLQYFFKNLGIMRYIYIYVCELDTMCVRFWWGQIGKKRKIHQKNWSYLTQSKKEGGMGFRDIRSFNLAMLEKQGWRLFQDKSSLLYSCFKAKYFLWCDFLEVDDCQNSSYVWKSLVAAQPMLREGSYWRVG